MAETILSLEILEKLILGRIDQVMESFGKSLARHPKIIAVDPIKLADDFEKDSESGEVSCSGKIIFQHSERDEKICLDLKFILSGENKAIVEIQPIENKKGYCHYFLDCSAKEIAKEVISHFFG